MLTINKITGDHVIDFAAEELKKYLRMMSPEGGDIAIAYAPDAKDGFRLGLLSEFGLPDEAEDPVLDDVIHIEAGPDGGVLSGSNPRSVLFAVYRFLRINGCRWLYPGVDGEIVPEKPLEKVSYHKKADMRFRGHCNEGAESQQCMLETIDFYAKQELNVYMMEFKVPFGYYNNYYSHKYNAVNRPPEPISEQQVVQWKRQCETEIAKRGLQFHDMGHGWTADPFGMHTGDRSDWKSGKLKLTDGQRKYIAMINGRRELVRSDPLQTNLCFSNPEVRSTMARAIADYAENHQNVTYLHVWLADSVNFQCECENCRKKTPTDWYIDVMNETDALMTKRGLDNRVVFISYVDTLFAPEKERINNPRRFALLYAPISRTYMRSVNGSSDIPAQPKFELNKITMPHGEEENFAFVREWKKSWTGPSFIYEYHFWRTQYYDLGGIKLARRIYDDIRGMKELGMDGFVEDGSQRSFFPNGFPIYVYAETQMNTQITFEELEKDYFGHIYGDDADRVVEYLNDMSGVLDFDYMFGTKPVSEVLPRLKNVREYAAKGRLLAKKHTAAPTRSQTASYRLLLRHAEYCDAVAAMLIEKAKGHDLLAYEMWERFTESFGKYEIEIERYYDHMMCSYALLNAVKIHGGDNYFYN